MTSFFSFEYANPEWVNGSGEIEIASSGVEYMREVPLVTLGNVPASPTEVLYEYSGAKYAFEKLPTEFVFREMLSLDYESREEVANFMGSYGLLYHPYRFSEGSIRSGKLDQEIIETLETTDSLKEERSFFQGVVSMSEAMQAARDLNWAIRTLLDFDVNGRREKDSIDADKALSLINAGRGKTPVLYLRGDFSSGKETWSDFGGFEPSDSDRLATLTQAICTQTLEVFAETLFEWHQCNCCGRWHKFKRSKTKTSKRPNQPPKYCSDACQNKAGTRRSRAKAKANSPE